MRIGYQIILYMLILNLVSGLVYQLGIPGTNYANVLNTGTEANSTNYAEEFNSTELLERTDPQFSITNVADYVFSGLFLLYSAIRSITIGFPDLVNTVAYSIPDADGRNAVLAISSVLYAAFAFLIFLWLFQLITNRRVSE